MEVMLSAFGYLVGNSGELLNAAVAVLVALIGLFMLIPGEQPEKFLQQVVNFVTRFSIKKSQ